MPFGMLVFVCLAGTGFWLVLAGVLMHSGPLIVVGGVLGIAMGVMIAKGPRSPD